MTHGSIFRSWKICRPFSFLKDPARRLREEEKVRAERVNDVLQERTEQEKVETSIIDGECGVNLRLFRGMLLDFYAIGPIIHKARSEAQLHGRRQSAAMDDLLDLNWTSSSSSKPAASPAAGLSAGSTHTSRAASPATYSAFDSLASASSNYAPNYTSSYPGQSGQTRKNGASVPVGRTPSPNPSINANRPQPSSSLSRDAFDSLFESTGSPSTSQKARESSLTLQDRIRMQSGGLGL